MTDKSLRNFSVFVLP